MGLTKEQRIVRNVVGKPTIQKFTPIATDMFLPNHSGIASHPEFKKAISEIDLSLYVPYTGATSNVNLGSKTLTTTGTITGGALQVDNININAASITSDTGVISFSNENLTTTGKITTGELLVDFITINGATINSSYGMNVNVADNLFVENDAVDNAVVFGVTSSVVNSDNSVFERIAIQGIVDGTDPSSNIGTVGGHFSATTIDSDSNMGIYAEAFNSAGINFAGYFSGDVFGTGDISGQSITDRSEWCNLTKEQAYQKIGLIKGTGNNQIDKNTLPNEVLKDIKTIDFKTKDKTIVKGRNIGAYLSFLTLALQEAKSEIEKLKTQILNG